MAALVAPEVVLAETEVKPTVSAGFVHVIDSDALGGEVDGHQVIRLNPRLDVNRKGTSWDTTFSLDHTEIAQLQSGFDDISYSNVKLENRFKWLQERIVFSVDASRNNRNIDTSFNGVSDPIFGRAEYIDVDTLSGRLAFSTSSRSRWQNSFVLSVSDTSFDESELEDTSTTTTTILQGTRQSAVLNLRYGQRPKSLRGNFGLTYSRVERETRGDQDSVAATFLIGVPLWGAIDVVATANMNRSMIDNSLLVNTDLENETYGAGLAWRFGVNSNLEITYNKDSRGDEDEFVGYKLEVFPSQRTSFQYEQSKRFYGESHSLRLAHRGNRWTANVNYSESLSSQTRLNRTEVSLGTFLCPFTAVTRADCTPIDEVSDIENQDLFPEEFFEPEFSLDEEVTLSKSGSANITYQLRKLALSASYSKGEVLFLERNATRDLESYNVSITYDLTRRNALKFSASESESVGDGVDRKGKNISLSFERKLSRKANGTFSISEIDNEASNGINNRKETRAELTYKYSF